MENLPTPNDREEKILYAIATGDMSDLPTPKTRTEKLLMGILENGSMAPGGGGTSDVAWKPTVAADGTISWIRSTSTTTPTPQNIKGPKGDPGENGQPGEDGDPGLDGADGKSAYQIWLDAGNTGTEDDFLLALIGAPGPDGKSAYEIWLEQGNVGSEQDFLDSLKGEAGEQGQPGEAGQDGKSAYEIWLEQGNSGSEADFLESLKGEPGADGTMTFEDLTEEQKESLNGFSPIITENEDNTDDVYKLDIETKDGKFTTPNLKGKDGEGSKSYTHSVKVTGTIGSNYYSTSIDYDEIREVYETGNPITGLYGGWTLDRVESDDDSMEAFSKFAICLDKQITATPDYISVYDLFSIQYEPSASVEAGAEYTVTYEWNASVIDDDTKDSDTTWSSSKILIEMSNQIKAARQIYYEISQLEINGVVPGTIDEVFQSMPDGTVAMIPTDQFPYSYRENFPGTKTRLIMCRMRNSYAMAFLVSIESGDFYTSKWVYDSALRYAVFVEWVKQEAEGKVYTSLDELGLTADATVEDVVNALKNGEGFLAPVNTFTNYETIFPNKVPNDKWNKIHIIKGTSLPNSHIRCFSQSGACEYLANVNNTNVTSWNDVSGTYTDISDSIIEKLGNEILKYPVGKYRINSITTGNKFTDLPSDAETKCGLIEINGTAVGKSPFTDTWVYRMYKFECLTGTSSYVRRLNSGATAGQIELDTGWCKEGQAKKEEDSYIPNVYDRNANGDMPVVPFDRLANCIAVRSNRGLVSTTETEATYNEDYVGGYVFIGANDILVKDKEMFNKIKVLVHIPGVLRIGIVNEKIYEANPRYSTCLVKWLVADFVAFTGMKEYDIADTVLEEGQSIFLECRTGVSSWYLNTGEATQVGAITYPANSCTTGLRVTDKLDSTTNNILFKSQKVNSSSCLTSFGTNMYSIGGNIRGNFRERAYNSGASSTKKADENFEYFGGLNVGLYRRTKYSDTRVCKCIENAMNNSWVGDDNVTKIYASHGQERLVGKSVYAIKLDVRIPGNLTIYHLKGKSLDTVQVIDKYTHYVRAIGLQTIHLPFDIKINSTDEYIGFGGFHCKSTSDNIVKHSCQWQYLDISQATWMTTVDNNSKKFYSIGLSNTDYPEKFTSFETNNNYVNIELICRGEKRSPLEDKYISFTGDSITTYTGFCTTKNGYPEGNPAGDNAVYYPASGKVVNNVDATWWGILARDNRMKILRNDAWSGSRVSSSEGSTDTKCLCGANRRYYLRNGYNFATNSTYPFGRPEIVVSMIGTNDLSGNVELGSEMFRGVMGAEEEYKTILSAFSLFCRRIHDQEGNGGAKIVHFLIPRGSDYGYANANGVTIADLSLHFERIAKAWGQYFIPLSYFNGIKPNAPKRWSCPTGSMFKNTSVVEFPSADGLHPNAMGMEAIADGVDRFLKEIM